jgi:hypothetical protein
LEDRCVPAQLNVTSPVDNANQPGTLRWAVDQAKNGDVIDIQTSQPIVLTHGELYLAHDVTIDFAAFSAAPQATISGDHRSRVFEVAPTAHVHLDHLDIVDGIGVANNPLGTQSADGYGGAIFNRGTLSLAYCTLSDNGGSAFTTGGPSVTVSLGGGIYNEGVTGPFDSRGAVGELTLTKCDLIGNGADAGGGIMNAGGSMAVLQCTLVGNNAYEFGGALDNDGVMVVAQSELDLNLAGLSGGAIENEPAALLFVLNCQLKVNFTSPNSGYGGGINNNGGSLLAIDCLFIDNHTEVGGGGIANGGGHMNILDCNFVNNYATQGGAIYNGFGGTAIVETSFLINNAASSGGGIYNDVGSVLNLGFSWLQTNFPDNLNSPGTYNDLGGNTFI